MVDMQITFGPDGEIHQAVPRQLFEHMIEEADPGIDVVNTGPIDIYRNLDVRFFRFS